MSLDGHPALSIADLVSFLQRKDVETYFSTHPNQLSSPTFLPPPEWESWWLWACSEDSEQSQNKWLLVWQYYAATSASRLDKKFLDIPESLRELVDSAREMRLGRRIATRRLEERDRGSRRTTGMSPKKEHEVERMTSYIADLLDDISSSGAIHVQHVVDIGAGQAYLSRSLRDELCLNILALDCSDIQSQGAAKREKAKGRSARTVPESSRVLDFGSLDDHASRSTGTLDYKTVNITSDTLLAAINEWIHNPSSFGAQQEYAPGSRTSVPVLLVALHACGSLTLDILRAFVAKHNDRVLDRDWTPEAAVIVGCCYNLLRPDDHVLKAVASNGVLLSSNHLQLAAQTPDQWGTSTLRLAAARLAIRKVAWRALLEGMLLRHTRGSTSEPSSASAAHSPEGSKRLGRLNDTAYTDWSTFLAIAQRKLGVEFVDEVPIERDLTLESRLCVLQVLRCLLGPVVESLILLDRQQWLQSELQSADLSAELVNLFDQDSGSGRNVAIVVRPNAAITRTRYLL